MCLIALILGCGQAKEADSSRDDSLDQPSSAEAVPSEDEPGEQRQDSDDLIGLWGECSYPYDPESSAAVEWDSLELLADGNAFIDDTAATWEILGGRLVLRAGGYSFAYFWTADEAGLQLQNTDGTCAVPRLE